MRPGYSTASLRNAEVIGGVEMMIDCDKSMITCLLRNWHPNRLRPRNVPLSKARPLLIEKQQGICPACLEPTLVDHGKSTHFDHVETVKEFADKVIRGELAFDEAYCRLWADSNLRAVHAKCNYGRNRGRRPRRT